MNAWNVNVMGQLKKGCFDMRNALTRVLAGSGAVLGVTACGLIAGPDTKRERQLARIELYGTPVQVSAPDTVSRGATFTVTVRSYGGGCVAQGDTEVHVSGLTAEVLPYDIFLTQLPENTVCPAVLYYYDHAAPLRFDQAGVARIRVRGRSVPADSTIVVERAVQVR